MNEFDLRSYLYNNPLLESEAKLKAAKKKLEKQEAKLDKVDMKDEDAKEKAKHHKDAIKNVKKEIKDLERDLKFDEKAAKKEEKEAKEEAKAKKKKKAMKEGMGKYYEEDSDSTMEEEMDSKYEEDYMKEGMGEYYEDDDKKKMTKEGLKSMIREKITSILTEQEDDEVDVDVQNKVDVKDKEKVDVDVEKEKEIDDVSKETDIDVKTSLPGESEDVDAILGLLTKASEEADRFSDDPELKTQIGNTITYFTRKHIAKPTNEELEGEVNELFGFGKKKRAGSGGSDSKGFAMFAYGKDGGKRRIGSGKTAKEARRDGDFQNYRRRYAVDKFEVVNLDNDQVVDTMKG